MYYICIGLPFIIDIQFSQSYISFLCIRIILTALLLCLCSNIILSATKISNYIKARRRAKESVIKILPMEMNQLHPNDDNQLKVSESGRCDVSFSSVIPYSDDFS